MVHEIILGRSPKGIKKYGTDGTIFIGKQYITMGKDTSLANRVLLDVVNPHVLLICGKRGSGKSYTMGVIAEGIASLPDEVRNKISCLFFDTMGIYWTMKYPNMRDDDLLDEWEIESKGFESEVRVFVPKGKLELLRSQDIPVDGAFSISCKDLSGIDWCSLLEINVNSSVGILINRVIIKLLSNGKSYGIRDIIKEINKDTKSTLEVKEAAINSFESADSWGLFSKEGVSVKELLSPGKINVVDISMYAHIGGGFSIRALIVGLISKKILEERIIARKLEEKEDIERGWRYFQTEYVVGEKEHVPLVWIFLDEAHEFLPREGKTLASNSLIQIIREGRQPGISFVLATQQPGKIHTDVITQSDLVLSHRVTSRIDIQALNNIMQTYLAGDIQTLLNMLPPLKGSAIVLDDKVEKMYPIQIRPRITWHGGSEPSLIKPTKKFSYETEGLV